MTLKRQRSPMTGDHGQAACAEAIKPVVTSADAGQAAGPQGGQSVQPEGCREPWET